MKTKKIVILGCENSHANQFMNFIKDNEKYKDVEVIGAYTDDAEAGKKFNETFGVYMMKSCDELKGKVDGVAVTARHGDNHYKYIKPYLTKGLAIFMDKPITIKEKESVEMMREIKSVGARVTGGSCCKFIDSVQKLKEDVIKNKDGKTLSGIVRAPVSMHNAYGDFFFYSQHLVEMEGEIFGRYPKTVSVTKNGDNSTVVFDHGDFSTIGLFTEGNYTYYVSRESEKGIDGELFYVGGESECFLIEFNEFYELLCGKKQKEDFDDIIAPVFTLNAIVKSMRSGKTEKINYIKV